MLQHLLHRLADELALVVEGGADSVEVDFRLAQDHAGNARHDVLQMLGGADAAGRARRIGNNARRLAEETALAIGPRANVDGVLQHARNRAVIFGRTEQYAVRLLQLFAERQPVGRGRRFEILVEKGNAVQRGDVDLKRARCEFRQRVGDLERKTLLAKAADDRDDVVGHLDFPC